MESGPANLSEQSAWNQAHSDTSYSWRFFTKLASVCEKLTHFCQLCAECKLPGFSVRGNPFCSFYLYLAHISPVDLQRWIDRRRHDSASGKTKRNCSPVVLRVESDGSFSCSLLTELAAWSCYARGSPRPPCLWSRWQVRKHQ